MADIDRSGEQYAQKYPGFAHAAINKLRERKAKADKAPLSIDEGPLSIRIETTAGIYTATVGLGVAINVGKEYILLQRETKSAEGFSSMTAKIAFRSKGGSSPSPSKPENIDANPICRYGFKIHVSLNENDPVEFARGWDIVKDILISRKVAYFKVVRNGYKMSDEAGQEGKDITIYCHKNIEFTKAKWLEIMQEITQQLAAAGISPGYCPSGQSKKEYKVEGSHFVTYRFDSPKKEPEFDELEKFFSNLNMVIPNQKPIQYKQMQNTEGQSHATYKA